MNDTIVIDTGCGQVDVPLPEPKKRECNRHLDCDRVDERARAAGRRHAAEHCHDEWCDDCFGS